jgi:hypothetical protein
MSPQATFEDCFAKQYAIIHRLETNKLRNVAKLFAHLLSVDAISWGVLGCIRLTEDDTTSSSRIFIKYLFQVGLHQVLVPSTCFTRIVPFSIKHHLFFIKYMFQVGLRCIVAVVAF